ncbi:hypothetical protein SJAV_21330 [Sulfurisphaera javensis]|uniref:Uncharacterized protein n=1 Tax=Sulfurisphaera javensis TaxID=2049879 RepID=A0AAT9GTE0_9CREN
MINTLKRNAVILIILSIILTSIIAYEAYTINETFSHSVNIFFLRNNQLLQGVSVTLFAFYPTSHGTVIKKIYQARNVKYVTLPLSNLTSYAEHWIKYYRYRIIPSLLGFATYTERNNNNTITVYTQPFTIPISPYNVTHGISESYIIPFINPIVKTVKLNSYVNSSNNNNKDSYTFTTVTTTVPKNEITGPNTCIVLNNVWYYPSQNSLGPVPLAAVYVTNSNLQDYSGALAVWESSSSSSGFRISFGVTFFGGAANLQIIGASITTSSSSMSLTVVSHFGDISNSQFAEIYTYGQIAVANFTEYQYCYLPGFYWSQPIGSITEVFFTALQLNGTNSNYVPALYSTNTPQIPIQKFFSFTNNYVLVKNDSISGFTCIYDTASSYPYTSYGYLSGGISLSLIVTIAKIIGLAVPSWVSILAFVISPYLYIGTFTQSINSFVTTLSITILEPSGTYNIYMLYSNATYNINDNNYSIPINYFYIKN